MRRSAFVFLLLVAVSCSQASEESVLEKGPRVPADEGTVTEINFNRVVLDDARPHRISDAIESYTTRGHKITPLVHHKGRYVHLGLNSEKQVAWIASIGIVAGEPPRVVYAGVFEEMSRGRAVFRDGTTLKLADGVRLSGKGKEFVLTIDAKAHEVIEASAADGGGSPEPAGTPSPEPTDVQVSRYP